MGWVGWLCPPKPGPRVRDLLNSMGWAGPPSLRGCLVPGPGDRDGCWYIIRSTFDLWYVKSLQEVYL